MGTGIVDVAFSAPPRRTGVSISFQNVNRAAEHHVLSDLPIIISTHLFDPTIGKIMQNGVDQILTKLKVYSKKFYINNTEYVNRPW